MLQVWKLSRRGFAGLLLAPLFRLPRLHGQATPASAVSVPTRTTARTYRADAVILLLGIPIYKRSGVGGGKASLEVTGDGAEQRRTFFFAAGSDPARARGLSRLGWIREVVHGPDAALSEVSYFGVMTSSPEESLDTARKSVSAAPPGRSLFSAVSGRNAVGRSRSALTHFEFASSASWSDQSLIDHAQATFRGDTLDWRETGWPKLPNQTPPTFLLELARLLKQRAKRAAGRYVYNEREYLLEIEAQTATHDRVPLLPFRGKIRNLGTNHETLFRVWLDGASESLVPTRIEFQARSFLKLTFESVPA